MEPTLLFQQLALSMLLGALVGLQRERTDSSLAGFRTFPLISLLGTVCALLSGHFESTWILAAGMAGVLGLAAIGNFDRLGRDEPERGVTTEAAMLLMFAIGAFLAVGPWIVAIGMTGGVAILLQMKPQLHGFAARLGDRDIHAVLQFMLVAFIILPILPNEEYDPLQWAAPVLPGVELPELKVLNPRQIWKMVVLVTGTSLGGYIVYKLFGKNAGTLLAGLLGGTISSTATTMSYARRTVAAPETAELSAVVIAIATAVSFVRILFEIAVVGPSVFPTAAPPILILLGVSALLAAGAWFFGRPPREEMPEQGNPTELKSALIFAAIYGAVLVGVAAAREMLPREALFGIAIFSGMTDMDAITLSTARLAQSGQLDSQTAWQVIVIAAMSNLAFKAGMVGVVGNRRLFVRIAILFGIAMAAGGLLLWLW